MLPAVEGDECRVDRVFGPSEGARLKRLPHLSPGLARADRGEDLLADRVLLRGARVTDRLEGEIRALTCARDDGLARCRVGFLEAREEPDERGFRRFLDSLSEGQGEDFVAAPLKALGIADDLLHQLVALLHRKVAAA